VSVRVYVADGCPHCAALLCDLKRRHVRFEVVNLSHAPDRITEVVALTRERRLPLTVDHERVAVGFSGGSSSFAELHLHVSAAREGRHTRP
jgi:glutaredoxin